MLYMALLTAFSFLDGQKNEKKIQRGSRGEGRRESWRGSTAGGAGEDRRREGGGMAGGVPVVLVVVFGTL